jgi:hypothetical protein
LKTADRKVLQVRVLSPPPFKQEQSKLASLRQADAADKLGEAMVGTQALRYLEQLIEILLRFLSLSSQHINVGGNSSPGN